jgi:hypothetical protein
VRFESELLNPGVNAGDAIPDGGVIVIGTEDVERGAGAVGTLPSGSFVKVSMLGSLPNCE